MMDYEDIPKLSKYSRILVTGAQRSGTQIAGRIIARVLDYEFHNWKTWSANPAGITSFLTTKRVVWQNPSMVGAVPFLRANGGDLGIVFVWRELADIHASEERIGWTGHAQEVAKMCMVPGFDASGFDIAKRKQEMWSYWANRYPNLYTIPYQCLSADELWAPKTDRVGWLSDQTRG